MEDQALRMCICKTGRELLENRLVARTWGNVSARADDMHYLVTPSGMDYGSITPEDIALCDLADGKWTGPRRPSGERAVHALAYSMFEDAHFVIHTHQTYASALGLCGYKPGCFTGEERQQLGGVAVAGYGLPGTKTLQNAMREAMAHGAKTILMAHHGVLICARSHDEALMRAQLLERLCRPLLAGCIRASCTGHGTEAAGFRACQGSLRTSAGLCRADGRTSDYGGAESAHPRPTGRHGADDRIRDPSHADRCGR